MSEFDIAYGGKIESSLFHINGGVVTTRDLRAQMAEIAGVTERDAHNVGKSKGSELTK